MTCFCPSARSLTRGTVVCGVRVDVPTCSNRQFQAIKPHVTTSPKLTLQGYLALLPRCDLHAALQVFSSNEEVDDVDTSMLPMLGADYYLGSLLLKLPFTSPEVRVLEINDTCYSAVPVAALLECALSSLPG